MCLKRTISINLVRARLLRICAELIVSIWKKEVVDDVGNVFQSIFHAPRAVCEYINTNEWVVIETNTKNAGILIPLPPSRDHVSIMAPSLVPLQLNKTQDTGVAGNQEIFDYAPPLIR